MVGLDSLHRRNVVLDSELAVRFGQVKEFVDSRKQSVRRLLDGQVGQSYQALRELYVKVKAQLLVLGAEEGVVWTSGCAWALDAAVVV